MKPTTEKKVSVHDAQQARLESQRIREKTSASASVVYDVLYTYVDWRGDDIGTCYPSINTIVKDSGLSKRTVLRSIELLERKKIIIVTREKRPDGKQAVNRYNLMLDQS